MRWKKFLKKTGKVDIDNALVLIASEPVKSYLIAMMEEMVRQGIYLEQKEQEAAKFFIKRMTEEIAKGERLLRK